MRPTRDRHSGFTLIELMIVVAIIGLLAVLAVPKFANLVLRSQEAVVKGHLGSVRSAISIYYANTEGIFPVSLFPLIPDYIEKIPATFIPGYYPKFATSYCGVNAIVDALAHIPPNQNTPWSYFNATGQFVVNCTHPDSSGRVWSTW